VLVARNPIDLARASVDPRRMRRAGAIRGLTTLPKDAAALAVLTALTACGCADHASNVASSPPPTLAVGGKGGAAGGSPSGSVDSLPGTWTNRTPSTLPMHWPLPGQGGQLAYDGARGAVVLFGDPRDRPAREVGTLREWNSSLQQWTDLTPAPLPVVWPPSRSGHAMAWDSRRRRLVVFGGYADEQPRALNDLWAFDDATGTWENMTPTPLPPAWPSARLLHALAYDSARDRLILFGGFPGVSNFERLADVWEWDGDSRTWTNATPDPLPASWPTERYSHTMVYDSKRQRTVVVGGYAGGPSLGDVWEWDGVQFVDRTPSPLPANWPAPRSSHAMAYQPCTGTLIVFGGQNSQGTTLGDTWQWDGTLNFWVKLTVPSPPARRGAGMAYDDARSRAVLFGGVGHYGELDLSDTWEYAFSPCEVAGVDGDGNPPPR